MFPRTLTFPFMNGLCPCLCGRLISEEPFINDISILIWKFESETHSVMSNSLWPHVLYSPRNSPGQNTRVGSLSLLQGIFPTQGSNPGIKPRTPALQADSLQAEPQGKGKNTGVSSLSLPQGIFPTQELNQGLLHCRWILYQLSYWGRP